MTVYVDYDFIDVDSDTPTFGCNRTDLFTDFNTDTGSGTWSTGITDAGTYFVDFGVSDGQGSTDNYTMTITVNDTAADTDVSQTFTPHDPVSLQPLHLLPTSRLSDIPGWNYVPACSTDPGRTNQQD
jgi:hypothetical protein